MRLELEGNFTSHAEQVRWLEQHRGTNTSSNWNHTLCMIVVVVLILIPHPHPHHHHHQYQYHSSVFIIDHQDSSSIIMIHPHPDLSSNILHPYHPFLNPISHINYPKIFSLFGLMMGSLIPAQHTLRSRCRAPWGDTWVDHQIHQLISRKRFKIQQLSWQSRGIATRQLDQNMILTTPWKINMEPTNHPFRKENALPKLKPPWLCSMLIFRV